MTLDSELHRLAAVAAAVLAVLVLWMLGARNRVTALRGAVLAAWGPVDEAMRLRGQAVGVLLAEGAAPLAAERPSLDAVQVAAAQVSVLADAVRRRPAQREAVSDLSRADARLAAALQRLLALLEQHGELAAQPAVRQAVAELAELRPRLAFTRKAFNEAGAAYNAATAQFPTRLLAPVFRFGEAGTL